VPMYIQTEILTRRSVYAHIGREDASVNQSMKSECYSIYKTSLRFVVVALHLSLLTFVFYLSPQ